MTIPAVLRKNLTDITYTAAISGVSANFLNASLAACGLDPKSLPKKGAVDIGGEINHEARAWKDIWSAGQGDGTIPDVLPTSELIVQLARDMDVARSELPARLSQFVGPFTEALA